MVKIEKNFPEFVNQQKNDRVARESLQELLRFNDALDSEINRLKQNTNNTEIDVQMLQYMTTSKSLFENAMQSMRIKNGDQGRLAFIQFADSVQDMMGYIHKMRLH